MYDVREVINLLSDKGSVLEIRPEYGIGMITAFVRVEGHALGLIANNPHHLAGAIDSDGADKGARFLQLCDAFDLPVINVGSRQIGRLRAPNVIDVPCREADIRGAIDRARGATFRRSLNGLENPFGDGRAAERIVEVLKTVALDDRLVIKRFADIDATTVTCRG